ncbi:hypothetical protein TEA_004093 [Camellia sinensis var. sinensis]|uniref:Uncharacterized protein n=1 Tax=Camellia sinensis var. sinensis TaxID=542762 RepID=A0A4S4ELC8_CAMSN|nr:hypothetical protein TEA_004093 [Camellia sinensis var. sinensis]
MDSIFSALALQRNVGFSGNVAQRNQQEDKFDTDLGRLAGPSLLRLANEAISSSTRGSQLNGKMSAEIWDDLEQTLEKGSSVFSEPSIFGCYFVMDPNSPTSVNSVCPIIDTVVMNPPFGTQKKGAVMDFLFATLKTRNATRLIALTIATSLGDLTHTLGTLVPVIGANGFATTAAAAPVIGTVVGSFR